jgi:hypothetical protein
MKTRLTFLPYSDAEEFCHTDGYIEKDFDTKQMAFDYLCYYAVNIDIAYIQIHGKLQVDTYNSESGFLKELVKKQNRNDDY